MTQVLPGPVAESCGKVFTCITVTIKKKHQIIMTMGMY
jgi:hypothetical protein